MRHIPLFFYERGFVCVVVRGFSWFCLSAYTGAGRGFKVSMCTRSCDPRACFSIGGEKEEYDTSTTTEINTLRAIANTTHIILLSKPSHMARSPTVGVCVVKIESVWQTERGEESGGTYRNREAAALSGAAQPRNLTTFSASDWHLCVFPTLTLKPLKKTARALPWLWRQVLKKEEEIKKK